MFFFSDTRETSARYGNHIAEFQELCREHEVDSGTPEDFFRLAPKLAYDEKFRADFCRLTKSVAERENGHLSLTRMLTIIALAMGGEGIDAIGTAGAVPVSLVVVFLAGVGGWNNEDSGEVASESLTSEQLVQPSNDESLPKNEEMEALELERRLAAEPNDLGEMAASLFGGPALVKEALCRLELNTLELKLHLDSIDSRMERIEPHLDDLTLRLAKDSPDPLEVQREAEALRRKNSLPRSRFSQPELRIETHAPETNIVPAVESPQRADTVEVRHLHRLVTALVLLLVAMAGVLGTLLYLNHNDGVRREIGNILSGTIGDASAKTTSTAKSPTQSAREPESVVLPPAPILGIKHTESDSVAGVKSELKPTEASPKTMPASLEQSTRKINLINSREDEPPNAPAIHLADALPGAVALKSENSSGFAIVRAEPASPNATPDQVVSTTSDRAGVTALGSGTKIFVPANTLVRNAIASPPPLYPSLARIQRVEGDVLLQAFVDETGKIENVSVVNGPEPLRNAAMDALRNWRFRPYLIDGHPVAVRTLVDFHFKMTP